MHTGERTRRETYRARYELGRVSAIRRSTGLLIDAHALGPTPIVAPHHPADLDVRVVSRAVMELSHQDRQGWGDGVPQESAS